MYKFPSLKFQSCLFLHTVLPSTCTQSRSNALPIMASPPSDPIDVAAGGQSLRPRLPAELWIKILDHLFFTDFAITLPTATMLTLPAEIRRKIFHIPLRPAHHGRPQAIRPRQRNICQHPTFAVNMLSFSPQKPWKVFYQYATFMFTSPKSSISDIAHNRRARICAPQSSIHLADSTSSGSTTSPTLSLVLPA